MNVFSVIEAADKAGKYVREGNGPYIIEVQTYRYRGHSMSDPAKYRTKEELDNYKQTDPIEIVKAEILKKKIATNDEIEKINKDTLKEIKNAAEFATNSPFPKDRELYTDVYL
jgi:Pyruvate/2-oxoglutarate dehydrogenase complex, dehydrogenase (E1) component, eukaryotic type, alpha subunit